MISASILRTGARDSGLGTRGSGLGLPKRSSRSTQQPSVRSLCVDDSEVKSGVLLLPESRTPSPEPRHGSKGLPSTSHGNSIKELLVVRTSERRAVKDGPTKPD